MRVAFDRVVGPAIRGAFGPLVLAGVGVGIGVLVSLALQPLVQWSSLVLLLVATAVVTWRGGWRAGMASSVLSMAAADSLIHSHAVIGEAPDADLLLLALLGIGGGVLTVLVASLDASRRRADALAAELQEATAALRTRLQERNRLVAELDAAREQAESASRAKGEFLNTMSHELRTPLNAIAGYAELIQIGVYGPVTTEQITALARLRTSQRYLLDLVNAVLRFAKLDADGATYACVPVPVDRVVETAETLVLAQCALAGLTYNRGGGPRGACAYADERQLDQILVNLLGNACKYTPAPGEVSLSWEVDPEHVRLHVADTGRGIDAAAQEAIFEPFVQVGADGARSTPQGTGLGLAISRRLARGMGGDLRVASAPGVGSRFTLELPRAPVGADRVLAP